MWKSMLGICESSWARAGFLVLMLPLFPLVPRQLNSDGSCHSLCWEHWKLLSSHRAAGAEVWVRFKCRRPNSALLVGFAASNRQ